MAQDEICEFQKLRIDTLPIVAAFTSKLKLRELLTEAVGYGRYADALVLLVKSVLLNPQALYRVNEWRRGFDPRYLPEGEFKDDVLARALDKLFKSDRASLQTKIVIEALRSFSLAMDRVHNDSTTVKFYGAYRHQAKEGVRLKRGHSKDHRPDLKQLVYNLCVTSDGAVPVHFKAYDGNTTDDSTHWETWSALRSLLQRNDFLYVADCKLCVRETMLRIDKEGGRFITIAPRTRAETQQFADDVYNGAVRWESIWERPVAGKKDQVDVFETATGFFQLQEGFSLHWFRSSEKVRRDVESREQRIARAIEDLTKLQNEKRRGPKSLKGLRNKAQRILERHQAAAWLTVEVAQENQGRFSKLDRGKPTEDSLYRKKMHKVFTLTWKHNQEQINRSQAMDGIFPLVTNARLEPLQTLQNYKYQPTLEKRFSMLKSGLDVAPVFLKRNDRVEALMFVYFLAEMCAALIERQIRSEMKTRKLAAIRILPEERPTKTPTWTQISRTFEHFARYSLTQKSGHTQCFFDSLSKPQSTVLDLLHVSLQNS